MSQERRKKYYENNGYVPRTTRYNWQRKESVSGESSINDMEV